MNFIHKDTFTSLFTSLEKSLHINPPPLTILAYHSISEDNTIVDIHPSIFKKQIDTLKETCEFISLDDVVEYIQNEKKLSKPAVALTFDDGYKDLIQNVMPSLSENNIPASVFVLSQPQNANRAELANDKPLMNIEDLKILKRNGWTIGCHSGTHPNFADKKLNVQKEIIDSKKQLEQDLGFAIKYFVYPKGIYSEAIIRAVEKAEFSAAFAFEPGTISHRTDRFAVPRMPVDWTHSEKQYEAFFTQWGLGYLQMRHSFIKNFSTL